MEHKTKTVTARINPELLRLAKERSGVDANSALVELAIANLGAEDGFAEAFAGTRGRIPRHIDLSIWSGYHLVIRVTLRATRSARKTHAISPREGDQ